MTSVAVIEHPALGNTETLDLAWLTIPGSHHYHREIKAGPSYIIFTVKRRDRINACLCARLLNTQLEFSIIAQCSGEIESVHVSVHAYLILSWNSLFLYNAKPKL